MFCNHVETFFPLSMFKKKWILRQQAQNWSLHGFYCLLQEFRTTEGKKIHIVFVVELPFRIHLKHILKTILQKQ